MKKFKTVVLCGTKNGIDLIKFLQKKIKIDLVITSKVKRNSSPERLNAKIFCQKNGLKFYEMKSYTEYDSLKKKIKNTNIDLLLSISWQRLIPEWLISKSKIVIGAHGSHQGMNMGRGRSPMNWAILSGKKKFIVSIFKIIKKDPDSGPIIDTKDINIEKFDTINSLYLKTHIEIANMVCNFIKNKTIINNKKVKKIRYLPKISHQDGLIDWRRKSEDIYNFIRSKSKPYSGAYTIQNKKIIKIESSIPIITNVFKKYKPGTIVEFLYDKTILIKTIDGFIQAYVEKKIYDKLKKKRLSSGNFKKQINNIIRSHKSNYLNQKINQTIVDLSL
tara:strand:+ start:739 stop:1734 length:996 start_codon:yes stop_codon:yes gene_type:complete